MESCPFKIKNLLTVGVGAAVTYHLFKKISAVQGQAQAQASGDWPNTGNPQILVAGGAGYIASHVLVCLLSQGYDVTVVDNFVNSNEESIKRVRELTQCQHGPASARLRVYNVDMCDKDALENVFKTSPQFAATIHFAGLKAVGESVAKPLLYYENNLISTMNLLSMMDKYNVGIIVFSSSATVYGSAAVPITENSPTGTGITNPYGRTKYMIEEILRDWHVSKPANTKTCVILRYFNPVGAHPSGKIGEDPMGIPNNLMPFVSQVAIGRRPHVSVFGNDYDTPDGTGVRDYLHVMDLAEGHVSALKYVQDASSSSNSAAASSATTTTGATATAPAPVLRATCTVGPNGKSCDGSTGGGAVFGTVNFEQADVAGPCTITWRITGLAPGPHGFHIHEKSDFSDGCKSAGPHYNPHGKTHGGPCDEVRHVGDLGNIVAGADGVAEGKIEDHLIKLSGEFSVVGRSVMVHADVDDLGKGGHELSATTGNAGARIACGEIKLSSAVAVAASACCAAAAAKEGGGGGQGKYSVFNLGTGKGVSVLEMIAAMQRACGKELKHVMAPRREGDIATCYADASRAKSVLKWSATRTLDEMCSDLWRWQSSNPHGYNK